MFGILELLVFKNAGFNAAVAACSKQSWRAALGLLSLPGALPDTVPWPRGISAEWRNRRCFTFSPIGI